MLQGKVMQSDDRTLGTTEDSREMCSLHTKLPNSCATYTLKCDIRCCCQGSTILDRWIWPNNESVADKWSKWHCHCQNVFITASTHSGTAAPGRVEEKQITDGTTCSARGGEMSTNLDEKCILFISSLISLGLYLRQFWREIVDCLVSFRCCQIGTLWVILRPDILTYSAFIGIRMRLNNQPSSVFALHIFAFLTLRCA